ncbi:MAG: protein jag [Vicinamibacteria bacterium]
MKDQLFEGPDVQAALARAAQDLGLTQATLRYVVLSAGDEKSPARVAVMLDATAAASAPRPAAAPAPVRPQRRPGPRRSREDVGEAPEDGERAAARPSGGGVPTRLRRVVRELAESAGLEIGCQVQDEDQALVVVLSGPGREPLLKDGGQALRALEHLLQRMFNRHIEPTSVVVRCEGYRETRDAWLGERARELAAGVRADGVPRETEPLNAYDRRIVHMALADEPGVHTFSVGAGADRRVTVAPDVEGPANNPELL